MSTSPIPNLPPADELFSVRDEIKRLKAREDVLRALMLADPSARTGNATRWRCVTWRPRALTSKSCAPCIPPSSSNSPSQATERRVELRAITADGELLNLRSKAASKI